MLEERGRAKNYKIMRARETEEVVEVKGEEKAEASCGAGGGWVFCGYLEFARGDAKGN